MSSQIVGNFIGAEIIVITSGPEFFIIMWLIMMVAVIGFYFIKIPKEPEGNDFGSIKLQVKTPTFFEELCTTSKLIFNRKMLIIDLQLLYSGTSIAFWSGMLIPIMVLQLRDHTDLSDKEKEQYALFGMVCFGFGEVAGGIGMGMVIDMYGSRVGAIKNVAIALAMTASTYGSLYNL